jgi:hypothetical protein
MSSSRSDLYAMIDRIPEAEIPLVERFLQFLSAEPIGPEFAKSIRRGMAQSDAGETIVCTSSEEMVETILGDSSD